MKVGDYVARIENKWQEHNPWMEFPNDPPIPLGIIVSKGAYKQSWEVLESCGKIAHWLETRLKVVSDCR